MPRKVDLNTWSSEILQIRKDRDAASKVADSKIPDSARHAAYMIAKAIGAERRGKIWLDRYASLDLFVNNKSCVCFCEVETDGEDIQAVTIIHANTPQINTAYYDGIACQKADDKTHLDFLMQLKNLTEEIKAEEQESKRVAEAQQKRVEDLVASLLV